MIYNYVNRKRSWVMQEDEPAQPIPKPAIHSPNAQSLNPMHMLINKNNYFSNLLIYSFNVNPND